MLGADEAVRHTPRLMVRLLQRLARDGRNPFEHQLSLLTSRRVLPAFFLCPACLLTPSSPAIASHDQPWWRALATWSCSRPSSSRRNDATARSPTEGSLLLADAASCVASLMKSTIVDGVSDVNQC